MKTKRTKRVKLTPAEEIRQIKHWLVDADAAWDEWDQDGFIVVYLPPFPFKIYGDKQHIFHSTRKAKLAAWRDVKRQVERALAEK